MNEFLHNFADAINQPGMTLEPGFKLKELPNWDSLAILTTLAMIDEQYEVTLSGAQLQQCDTIADVYALVATGSSKDLI